MYNKQNGKKSSAIFVVQRAMSNGKIYYCNSSRRVCECVTVCGIFACTWALTCVCVDVLFVLKIWLFSPNLFVSPSVYVRMPCMFGTIFFCTSSSAHQFSFYFLFFFFIFLFWMTLSDNFSKDTRRFCEFFNRVEEIKKLLVKEYVQFTWCRLKRIEKKTREKMSMTFRVIQYLRTLYIYIVV